QPPWPRASRSPLRRCQGFRLRQRRRRRRARCVSQHEVHHAAERVMNAQIRVEAAEEGLRCFVSGEETHAIRWSDIREIEGFKRDLITTDLICLLIKYDDGSPKAVELNEDMNGFGGLVSELEHRSFLKSSWREYVTLPPFQPCRFVLFT